MKNLNSEKITARETHGIGNGHEGEKQDSTGKTYKINAIKYPFREARKICVQKIANSRVSPEFSATWNIIDICSFWIQKFLIIVLNSNELGVQFFWSLSKPTRCYHFFGNHRGLVTISNSPKMSVTPSHIHWTTYRSTIKEETNHPILCPCEGLAWQSVQLFEE